MRDPQGSNPTQLEDDPEQAEHSGAEAEAEPNLDEYGEDGLSDEPSFD